MPPNRKRSRAAQGRTSTRQGAGTAMLPVIRMHGRQHFDARSGDVVNTGTVEIMGDVRSEAFVCDGKLRHIKHGCGTGCTCIDCRATPRKYEMAHETIETCKCIRCRRRSGMMRND